MEKKFRLLFLLALLLTAATGAWADGVTMKEITGSDIQSSWNGNTDPVKATDLPGFKAMTHDEAIALGAPSNNELVYLIYAINASNKFAALIYESGTKSSNEAEFNLDELQSSAQNYWVYYTYSDAPAGYTVSLKDGVKDADKWTISPNPAPEGSPVTIQYTGRLKVKGVTATSEAEPAEGTYTLLSAATTADCGKVVCAAGHLHDAKTAVPTGCTAVGILGKVTETGHGLILALQDATSQNWNTINDWKSVTTYAGTTLKVLPDDARGTNLTSYTALGETAVSNWAVGGEPDYDAIFKNLGGAINDWEMYVLDSNVNAYITTGVGGSALDGEYWTAWTAEELMENDAVMFSINTWTADMRVNSKKIRPVLGFGGEAGAQSAKPAATVTTAPKGAAVVGVGKTTELVSGGVADGGTLMYAVTTTNTKPTSTDGFSDAVPTAQDITASGTVYVWYYVKGDDSHSDSEIAGPVSVTVAEATPALSLTNPVVGQVIGSDGKNYAAASVPSGVTKVAMIAYVSGSNGLAIALADEGKLNWATAKSTCEAKTPAFTGGTWHLPSQAEWNQMFSANGGDEERCYGLNTKINTAGGTALLEGGTGYWTSTSNGSNVWYVWLMDGDTDWRSGNVNLAKQVRACLAF